MNKRTDYPGEYPSDWDTIAFNAKRWAEWRCEHCGMEFYPSGKAKEAQNADGKPAILTIHHLDGNKANNTHENLLVCCQKCHLHIQAVWRPGEELPLAWQEVPAWITERGLSYTPNRQLRLF